MTWRTSSFSGSGGNCVQVRGDLRALQDSKRPGPVLEVDGLAALMTSIKSGRFAAPRESEQ